MVNSPELIGRSSGNLLSSRIYVIEANELRSSLIKIKICVVSGTLYQILPNVRMNFDSEPEKIFALFD